VAWEAGQHLLVRQVSVGRADTTPAGQTGERWQGGYNAPLPGAPDLLSSCPGQHIAAWRARLDLASNSLHGATLKVPHAGQRGREG
jgi:hypothetical protein